jgi:hypothetical protein
VCLGLAVTSCHGREEDDDDLAQLGWNHGMASTRMRFVDQASNATNPTQFHGGSGCDAVWGLPSLLFLVYIFKCTMRMVNEQSILKHLYMISSVLLLHLTNDHPYRSRIFLLLLHRRKLE